MVFPKFIATKGPDSANVGYFVPRLYKLCWCSSVLKTFGFSYIKERLMGWTIWWVENEDDYNRAIGLLKALKAKDHMFDYKVSR